MFKKITLLTACALIPSIMSSALANASICIKNNFSQKPVHVYVQGLSSQIMTINPSDSSCINSIPTMCYNPVNGGCTLVVSTFNTPNDTMQVRFFAPYPYVGVLTNLGVYSPVGKTNIKIDSYSCDASTCTVTVGPDNSE